MLPPPPSRVSLRCCPWRSSAMRLLPCSTHQPLHGVHHCASDTVSIHTAARSYTAIPVHASFLHRGSHTSLGGGRSPGARADAAAPSSVSNNSSPELCSSSTQREALNAQDTHRSATTSTATAADARVPPRVSSSAHYPVAATAVPALAPELRVRESPQRTPRVACVRIPRLLVFGGDVVSVTALEALHARMRCIVRAALRSRRLCEHDGSIGTASETCGQGDADAAGDEVEEAQVNAVVREHLTVVCPALPRGVTPEEAARKFTRQYPVARYCVHNGLPIIPVDHPKSLVKSTLLKEMLSTVPAKASSGSAASARNNIDTASQATTGACATTTATVSLFTDRPRRSPLYASLSSHIKSHVLSSTARVRPQGLTAPPSSSTVADSPAEGHTWAAEGRPLDDYDLVVVVSFRYFLPQKLLRVLPPVINMHPSLLPRYRGASPIFSALRNNETVGGVSIIQMKPEQKAMDSGSVLWQCEVPITPDMDIRLYFPLVTQIGAAGLCDLVFGEAPARPPPTAAAVDEQKEGGSARWSAAEVSEAVAMAAAATRTGRAAHLSYTPPARASVSARADLPCVHDGPGGDGGTRAAASHREGAETNDNADGCSSVPSWVALRRRSLVPVVHRSAHRVNLLHFTHDRERLSPHVERPELSIFSSIITAQTAAKRDGDEHTSAAGAELKGSQVSCAADVPPQRCRHWMSLCRGSTHVTPEAVHAASKAHRALFFQNLETASSSSSSSSSAGRRPRTPVNKKHVSPAAAAEMEISTAMKCAEVFPKSVLSPHCDWPDSFTYSWKFAEGQEYQTFANFKDDPFHAPLLPKDTAVLRFSAYDAMEAFGVWRAFVGGEYFQPSVNATLDKGGSPVRNQLVHRGVRRLLRERAKLQHKNERKMKKERKSGAEVPLVSAEEAATTAAAADGNSAQAVMGDDDGGAPVGMVVGKHVELDVFNPAGLQLLVEAENTLRTPCTFTQVTNPALLPQCVREELAEVEGGGSSSDDDACLSSSSSYSSFSHRGGGAGRRVRFYRPPPAIFRSLLSSRASMEAQEAEGHRRRERAARLQERKHRRCCGEESTTASAERDTDVPAAASAGSAAAAAPMTTATTQARCKREKTGGGRQPEEPAEDEEAPEDYVPDVIAVAPPSEQCRWHIPPGTGYFPVSDETYGAIKCRDGWFVWKEAHMKWSNKAQPAVLIRKGLAMKTGVLYVGLFSEYS